MNDVMSSIQAAAWAQEQMPEVLEELLKETFIREKDIESRFLICYIWLSGGSIYGGLSGEGLVEGLQFPADSP